MKSLKLPVLAAATLLFLLAGVFSRGQQKEEFLTEEELDKIRETQDPGERIELYLTLEQVRLDRFETSRTGPPDPEGANGAFLDSLMAQYIMLNDEMKNWIDYQFENKGDMRKGLRALLDRGPQQLGQLRRIQSSPDPYVTAYGDTLRDAIEQMTDGLDGATRALAEQEKKFAAMKKEEKAEAKLSKQTAKEEKKRTKEEEKLRKRQRRKGVPADRDQD